MPVNDAGVMADSKNHNSELQARVRRRQIDLLYANQTLAVSVTAIAVALLLYFLNLSVAWSDLQWWAVAFGSVLSLRLLGTVVYLYRKHVQRPLGCQLAESLYFS